MIVRRFMSWLRLTVAASLGGARRRSLTQPVREPALVGAASQSGLAERATSGLSLSSWLDNGHRLRPRLRLAPRDPGLIPTRPLRHKTQPAAISATPAPAAPAPAPTPVEAPAPRANLAPLAPEPTDATRIVPVTHTSGAGGDDLGDLERLDAETRRLMLLRHLVRQRVFNEGFATGDIPRQYRRSLGLEEPVPED